MEFFSDKPELLGNTQTLLGVLVTLIVLCLFNDESNFLLKLIRNMTADYAKNLQEKMADIRIQIQKQKEDMEKEIGGIVSNRTFWVRLAKAKGDDLYERILNNNKEEQNVLGGMLDNLSEPLSKFGKTDGDLQLKRENVFVSLFFLILLLGVMMIDACCISNAVGSLFLSILTFISAYYTLSLWFRFYMDQDDKEDYKGHTHNVIIVVGGMVLTVGLWLLTMALYRFDNREIWVFSFAYFVCMTIAISYKLMFNFRYCVRYNNQFVIKHAFYFMFLCAVITLLLWGIRNVEFNEQQCATVNYMQTIQYNIDMLVKDSKWTMRAFVLLATCNTFFIPLLVGYYYNYKKATGATHQMEINKQSILAKLKKNISEYQEILKEIQKR